MLCLMLWMMIIDCVVFGGDVGMVNVLMKDVCLCV